jgi:hypothetical protein
MKKRPLENLETLMREIRHVNLRIKTKRNIKATKDYFKYELLANQNFSDFDKYGEEIWND